MTVAFPTSLPAPVRLRPCTGDAIGTTAFFRNRALLDTLLGVIAASGRTEIRVLVHACSNGAEVYTLLIAAALHPGSPVLQVDATDREPDFVAAAAAGIYDAAILAGMTEAEQGFFTPLSDTAVVVTAALRQRARFLPPASFVDFTSPDPYDVVVINNALLYVDGPSQEQTLRRIAGYNTGWLVTTGFHGDRIEADLRRVGYEPIHENMKNIHDGWTDRRTDDGAPRLTPGVNYYPWNLPPFETGPGYAYRFGCLFARVKR